MALRRGDSLQRPGRKMAHYTHFLIGALALMSFVLLIKYRNLTQQMSEENISHRYSKKSLEDELGTIVNHKKEAEENLQRSVAEINDLKLKLKNSEIEISNTANALQSSNTRLEELKQEVASKTEAVEKLTSEKDEFQKLVISLDDELKKTKALSDDNAETLKAVQAKQEKLLNDNQGLAKHVDELTSVHSQNNALTKQLKESQGQVEELQKQLQEKTKQLEDVQVKAKESGDPNVQQAAEEKDNGANKTMADDKEKRSVNLTKPSETGDVETAGEDVAKLTDNLEDYDMLEEDVKEKIKKEIQANESAVPEANDEAGDKKEGQVLDDTIREGQPDAILESGVENERSNDDIEFKGPEPSFNDVIRAEAGLESSSVKKFIEGENQRGSFIPPANQGSSS